MTDLFQMLESEQAKVIVQVDGHDLLSFADAVIRRAEELALRRREELTQGNEFLPKKDVLELLGVCDTTLWHWQKTGYLVPRKIGRKILYRKDEVDSLLTMKAGRR